MIHATVVYTNISGVDTFDLITYVRGEGYWQLLCANGKTVLLPDASIVKIVLSTPTQEDKDEK